MEKNKVYRLWDIKNKKYHVSLYGKTIFAHRQKLENNPLLHGQGKDNYEIHAFDLKIDVSSLTNGGMLKGRNHYKPFDYPYAYDFWLQHEQMHWLPSEVSFESDVVDWQERLTVSEKEFLTQLFRFFTQADIGVNSAYASIFLPNFKNVPELNMLCSGIAGRESIHVHAYSQLIDTIGMDESEYKAFQEYEEMANKHEYLNEFSDASPYDLAKTLVVYNGFVEGMQLFSSFAMLLNFARYGKMNGMIEIVSWSLRDETIHVDSMCSVYHDFIKEYKKYINKHELNAEVRQCAEKMVELEDKFIDLAFATGGIEGLTPEEVKAYIRYTCDYRLNQYGMRTIYKIQENPLQWVDEIVSGKEHSNFFERRSTEYGKAAVKGSMAEIDWDKF